MKTTLLVLCLLSTTAAFAQRGAFISSEPQIIESPSHPAHAAYAPMSQEQNVLAATSYTLGQGDRRASDFPQAEGVSLGAFAREFRTQHAQLRKARVVWVNQ